MIIGSLEILTAILPNIMKPVKGETTIYEKLQPYMEAAEKWIAETFTSSAIFDDIAQEEDGNPLKSQVQRLVAYEAYLNAIPAMDLILTPNGFGIVSNQNVVPASKERIERLLTTITENRDDAITALLHSLVAVNGWTDTEQGKYFASTLFCDLTIARMIYRKEEYKSNWDWYLYLRNKLLLIENEIAENWISPELMAALRAENQSDTLTDYRRFIVETLQAVEMRCLKVDDSLQQIKLEIQPLRILVNSIKNSPEDAPEWHNSETAELFNPPVFENKKEDKGYWF